MVVNEYVFHFALKSLETCLQGSGTSNNPGSRANGDDLSRVFPLYLLDLQSSWFDDRGRRIVELVHRRQIQNREAAEWATLSYARGHMGPRRGTEEEMRDSMERGVVLDDIFDDSGGAMRRLVPAYALYDAVRIVEELGIRYLWVDVMCSFGTPPQDGGGSRWRQSYAHIFQGAKINIALPDYHCMPDGEKEYRKSLIGEPEEDGKKMEDMLNSILRGEDPHTQKGQEEEEVAGTGSIDAALFLYPFFTDPCAFLERLLSPRTLFCLGNGDAVWACAHHCSHSRYDRLHVNPRECLLTLPKASLPPPPIPRLPPPSSSSSSTSASSASSSPLPSTGQLQKEKAGALPRSTKRTRQDSEGTSDGSPRVAKRRKLAPVSGRKNNTLLATTLRANTLRANEASQGWVMPVPGPEPNLAFLPNPASHPCLMKPKGGVMPTFPWSTVIETFSHCHNMAYDEYPFSLVRILVDCYGIKRLSPAPWQWDDNTGHLAEDMVWYGDIYRARPCASTISPCAGGETTHGGSEGAYSMSWVHWVGRKVFLSSHWYFTKALTTSKNNSNSNNTVGGGGAAARTKTTAKKAAAARRGPHPLYTSLGKLDRGFEVKCARYVGPNIRWADAAAAAENRDLDADNIFAKLREASVSGAPTFLGAGLAIAATGQEEKEKPWGYDPPPMQWSKPCYLYDKDDDNDEDGYGGKLMGRGVVDDPAWFLEEMEKIAAAAAAKGKQSHRTVVLAFIERESLELRAADMPEKLPWELEPVSWKCRECGVADRVTLEVNYGLILLTSGGDGDGDGDDEEEEEEDIIDTDLYERVGVFEVYGKTFARDRAKHIYIR